MRDLLDCRDAIDAIDSEIISLLQQRQEVARDVARYKLAHNQGIVDKRREGQKLSTLMNKAVAAGISPSMVHDVYELIMAHTVSYEQSYIVEAVNGVDVTRNTSVAYLGTKGTYSHLATHRFFEAYEGRMEEHSCASFDEIVALVENGTCEYGVMPIENSNSGSINESVDIMQTMTAHIVGEIFYPIDHSILALPHDATATTQQSGTTQIDYSTIQTIYSHPQPVAQCSKFLKEHLTSAVALGSMHAARYYDLQPLVSDIANNKSNYTRFIILSKTPVTIPNNLEAKTSILFSTKKYTPGSLIAVLNAFSAHNINLTKLYSRPMETKSREVWEEIFFADVEANLDTPVMQEILDQLQEHTTNLKVLGCYLSAERR